MSHWSTNKLAVYYLKTLNRSYKYQDHSVWCVLGSEWKDYCNFATDVIPIKWYQNKIQSLRLISNTHSFKSALLLWVAHNNFNHYLGNTIFSCNIYRHLNYNFTAWTARFCTPPATYYPKPFIPSGMAQIFYPTQKKCFPLKWFCGQSLGLFSMRIPSSR